MNSARRVVVSVATGAGLAIIATGVNRLMASPPEGGWFMYSPEAVPTFASSSSDGQVIRAGAVWMIALSAWFLCSWWLFRERRR